MGCCTSGRMVNMGLCLPTNRQLPSAVDEGWDHPSALARNICICWVLQWYLSKMAEFHDWATEFDLKGLE